MKRNTLIEDTYFNFKFMEKIIDDLNKLANMYSGSGEFIKHIENYSIKSKELFNETDKVFQPLAETSIEILNLTLEILKYSNRKNWKGYYGTQYLLILNTIPSLYGSYKNIIDGFYIQSSMNLRSAFESLLRLYFINFNPTDFNLIFGKEAKKQLKEKGKVKNYPEFKIIDFIENDLKILEWIEIYHILSNESHSNMISVFCDMESIEKGDYDISVNMQGRSDVKFNVRMLYMLFYAFIKYIDDILSKNTIFDKPELEKQKSEIFKTKDYLLDILEKLLIKEDIKAINNIMAIIFKFN